MYHTQQVISYLPKLADSYLSRYLPVKRGF